MPDHDSNALPGCLHSSPKGTECVLPANHPGWHSWETITRSLKPLTKINPANEEEKIFWKACFLNLISTGSNEAMTLLAQYADEALQEYRKRLAHP